MATPTQIRRRGRFSLILGTLVAAVLFAAMAYADDITSDLPVVGSVKVMALNEGGPTGSTLLTVIPTGMGNAPADGKAGCNLTGGTSLVVSVSSSNTSVATVSPTSLTFTSCGDVKTLTVTPHATGSSNVTLAQTSNDTGATFNLAPAAFRVDVAPPPNTAPNVTVTGVEHGASYAKGSVPAAGCSVEDAEDGNSTFAASLSSITGPYASDGIGNQTATCSYTDAGGLTETVTATYSIYDPTAPEIGYTLSPAAPDGNNGWYKSTVSLTWNVSEPESSNSLQKTGCVDQSITSDQGPTTYSCSATSAGGSTGPVEVTIKRDATAPTISGAVSPASPDGDNGWYKTAPTVTFTCSDATSLIAGCVADGTSPASDSKTLGESASAQTVTGSSTDNAGNSNTSSVTGLKVDLSAPVITRNMSADSCSLPGTNDWCRGTQTAGFTATDAISGIALTGTSPVNFTQSTATNGAAVNIASGTKFDMAGHESNSIDAGPFKIDSVDPAVTCQSPAPAFLLNQPGAQVSASVADGTSGPLNATESGAADTSSVGPKTVSMTGYDNAGNSKTVSCSYSVGYGFDGLFAPVDKPNTLNVSKAGQAVPLKWRLTDYFGNPVTDLGSATVSVTNASCDSGSTTDLVEEYASGSSGLQNLGDGYYQFNWKSPTSYASSCKWLNLKLGAEPTRTMLAYFSFKK